ncbi:hypothetical protein BGZ60DRAFT_218112 [Tricladium varicosporioides]|nr:hypothetical protein BGZ60DRAFT_218112 [Hymenoscyphus varicosporioides]
MPSVLSLPYILLPQLPASIFTLHSEYPVSVLDKPSLFFYLLSPSDNPTIAPHTPYNANTKIWFSSRRCNEPALSLLRWRAKGC